MTDLPTLQNQLLALLRDRVLGTADPLDADTPLFDAGLDSMAVMQLMLLIESEFRVRLLAQDLTRRNFATVRTLAAVLHRRLDAPSA
jgi:acyl carrier protein